MPWKRTEEETKFQGDTKDKGAMVPSSPSIKAAGIWIFKPKWSQAGRDGCDPMNHLLHGWRLVNTPCCYMGSGNYWAIIPANCLVIKRWSLMWVVAWEAVAAFTSLAWSHPPEKMFGSQQIGDPFIEQLNLRGKMALEMVQSSTSWIKRKAIND